MDKNKIEIAGIRETHIPHDRTMEAKSHTWYLQETEQQFKDMELELSAGVILEIALQT